MISRSSYHLVSAVIFALIAVGHAIRAAMGWPFLIGGVVVPDWVSWVAVFAAGALSAWGFRQRS